jgi:putative flippase GtrA/glycosyltransferase involved in cell wall biosynthesis
MGTVIRQHQICAEADLAGHTVARTSRGRTLDVEVVVPVYNEQDDLEGSVLRLDAYLRQSLPHSYRITIADNASIDGTWAIARGLEEEMPTVRAVHLDQKGRGRALKAVWAASEAEVLAYMDVDLSTGLAALPPLVAALLSAHSDIAIGTRLGRGASVVRGRKRDMISRSYNLLLHAVLRSRFSDAQCGFKAIRADRARQLLPLVEDDGWFFDTELLVLAERAGLRVHEVPVDWVDDPDSRVDVVSTALGDLKGMARLWRGIASGRLGDSLAVVAQGRGCSGRHSIFLRQLVRFCVIGGASTLAYALLYVVLRSGMSAQLANALSLLITAVANTAANRRLTFGVREKAGRWRHQAQGLVVFVLGLAATSGSLVLLHRFDADPARRLELTVLIGASVMATLLRFVLFKTWLFGAVSSRDHSHGDLVSLDGGEPFAGQRSGDDLTLARVRMRAS